VVNVVSQEEFATWLASKKPAPAAANAAVEAAPASKAAVVAKVAQ